MPREEHLIIASLAILAFSVALAAGESAPAAAEPSTPAEARMLIERAKQDIAQEEKTWSEETAREKEAESRRRQRFSEFSQDRLRLQQTIAEQEEKLKASLAKMESHQFRDRELQARVKQLAVVIAAKAKELRAAMAPGLPFNMDKRLERLDLLVRDVDGGNISPEEAMNRLWTIEQSERRLAQEAEVYTGDFIDEAADPSGHADPIQVKYLRVGKQLLAFSSLDGARLGMLRLLPPPSLDSLSPRQALMAAAGGGAKPRYVWVREKDMDRETRQAIKNAIATAEGKALPGFVPVPVWKNAFASSDILTAGVTPVSPPTASPAKGGAK